MDQNTFFFFPLIKLHSKLIHNHVLVLDQVVLVLQEIPKDEKMVV